MEYYKAKGETFYKAKPCNIDIFGTMSVLHKHHIPQKRTTYSLRSLCLTLFYYTDIVLFFQKGGFVHMKSI